MSFTRVNPAGWTPGQQLTAAQINQLDTDHANAIDGSAPGVYDVGGTIELDNAALDVSGAVDVGGVLSCGANVEFDQNLDVGGLLDVTGNTHVGGTLTVDGAVDLNSNLNVDGTLSQVGTSVFTAGATFNGTAFFNSCLRLNWLAGANANSSISALSYSLVYAGALTAPRNYTISDSGTSSSHGLWIMFTNPTLHVLSILAPGGGGLISIANSTPGSSPWALVANIAGTWRVMASAPA